MALLTRPALALLLGLLAPAAAGSPGTPSESWGETRCVPLLEAAPHGTCRLAALADLAVLSCDDAGCAYRMDVVAGAFFEPGDRVMALSSTVLAEESACPPRPLREAVLPLLGKECHRACETMGMGGLILCFGTDEGDVEVPAGACATVHLFTRLDAVTDSASLWQGWRVCNHGDGTGDARAA